MKENIIDKIKYKWQKRQLTHNFSGKISDETNTKIMCRRGDNNKRDIKKMEYVKKKNFICLRSGNIGKHYKFSFQEILYSVNLVNREIKLRQISFHL